MSEYIQPSRTVLEFHDKAVEQKSIVFTWRIEDIRNISVSSINGLTDFTANYYITEDGNLGICVMTVYHSSASIGTLSNIANITFVNDKGYKQIINFEVRNRSTSLSPSFITLSQNYIISPFTLTSNYIEFKTYGGEQVTGCEFDSRDGVGAQVEGNKINIISAWNMPVEPHKLFRKAIVTVKTKDSASKVSRYTIEVYIIMPVAIPIWKDTDVRYQTEFDSVNYSIHLIPNGIDMEEKPIYKGKAYRKPDSDGIEFNLNRICANYLRKDLDPSTEGITASPDYGKVFLLFVNGKIFGSYVFYDSYTYTDDFIPWKQNNNIGNPIRNTIVRGQTFLGSMWITDIQPTGEYPLISECETIDGQYFPVLSPFGKFFPDGMQRTDVVYHTGGTAFLPETKYIRFGDRIYRLIENCGIRYVLHYIDKQGGYCSMPVEAHTNLSSKTKGYTIDRSYSNLTSRHETLPYLQHITNEYEVTLPLLRREEAMRIDEITQSNQIWLERLSDNKMIPVVLKDTDTDFKNNRKIRNYTLHFKASQRRIRR